MQPIAGLRVMALRPSLLMDMIDARALHSRARTRTGCAAPLEPARAAKGRRERAGITVRSLERRRRRRRGAETDTRARLS
jgi:hypothetical protein